MSHYYLRSKSKTNMKKWYFEYFIAVYFLSLFYDHPVLDTRKSGQISKSYHRILTYRMKNDRMVKEIIMMKRCQLLFQFLIILRVLVIMTFQFTKKLQWRQNRCDAIQTLLLMNTFGSWDKWSCEKFSCEKIHTNIIVSKYTKSRITLTIILISLYISNNGIQCSYFIEI